MRGYGFIKFFAGKKHANKVSLAHNKAWINSMIKRKAVIVDGGLFGAPVPGDFYGMELMQIAKHNFPTIKL